MNCEINPNEEFGQLIISIITDYSYSRNIEIGSWDGEGSTLCFVTGMKVIESDQKRLDCIEIVPEKFEVLTSRYRDIPWVKPFRGSSVPYDLVSKMDFSSIWDSPYNKLETDAHEVVKSWFKRDLETIRSAASFNYGDHYDCALIDGGEFTGYEEFKLLREKTSCLILDDVHKAYKCNQAYHELSQDTNWRLIAENPDCRHGYAAFQKVR
jgi:hypothetical protein